jgi:glycosyltransferase involved in cell wall biosynthesis
MEITIILKQKLEHLPPVCNLIDFLIEKEIKVNLICTDIADNNLNKYSAKTRIFIVELRNYKIRLLKIISIFYFRRKVYSFLESNNIGNTKNSYIWIASAEAAIGLGHKISTYKFIFQCHELYDKVLQYRILNKFYFKNSILNVCPEKNRAAIYRYWYSLKKTPSVLVNSPYYHPRTLKLDIDNLEAETVVQKLSKKKIILYMGLISPERNLTPFVEAVEKLGGEYHFVLLGRPLVNDGYLENVLNIFKNVSHIDSLPAPSHLQVASWAYIGILSYSFTSLNNVFCAPNKIWEYSGFGIPMISNDVPGIENLLTKYSSGTSINLDTADSSMIMGAILDIDKNYNDFSQNAKVMFNESEYKKQLTTILNQLN